MAERISVNEAMQYDWLRRLTNGELCCGAFDGDWGERGICRFGSQSGCSPQECPICSKEDQEDWKDFNPFLPENKYADSLLVELGIDIRRRCSESGCGWVPKVLRGVISRELQVELGIIGG